MRSSLLVGFACASLLSLPQCMRVTEGIEVDVAYQPTATPAQVRTDLGYRVALDRAVLVVGEVRLVRCDNFVADVWGLIGPSRARAHVLDTPTSLGEPVVLDLMESAGTPIFAGTLKPPPGEYCGLRIFGMPADADAVGLTKENQEMVRHTVLVAGQVTGEGGADEGHLIATVDEVLDCEMAFAEPLVFRGPVLEAVSIQIDHTRWFDGIDFAKLSSHAVRRQMIQNIRSSLRAVLPSAEDGL